MSQRPTPPAPPVDLRGPRPASSFPRPRPADDRARRGASRLLVAVLVAAAGLLGWLAVVLFTEPDTAGEIAAARDAARAARPGGVRDAAPALVGDDDRPRGTGPAGLAGEEPSRSAPAGGRRELSDPTIAWVTGSVLLPDGTPRDEAVVVESREAGFMGTPRDEAEVDPRGRFRVAFTADTSIGWLRLRGRYVWYPGSLSVRPGRTPEEELQLEPVLGGRIEGTLVLAQRGELPAGDLEVSLNGSPDSGEHWQRIRDVEFVVERDAGGLGARFHADAVPPGEYRLESSPAGFLSKVAEAVRVERGDTTVVDLELVPAPTLVGRVLDPNGDPVVEAEVQGSPRGGDDTLVGAQRQDDTDADGRFELAGLRPGTVEIEVDAEGFAPFEESFEVADAVADGDFVVQLSYGGTLAGRVIHADGSPARGATVTAKGTEGVGMRFAFRDGSSRTTQTDEEGRFFLTALGDGPFELLSSTRIPGEEGYLVARLEDVEVHAEDVVLTLGPGFSLSGRVVDLAGEPLERYALSIRPEGSLAFLLDPESVGIVSQRVRDDEGRFFVDGLLPGTWSLNVVAGGYGEVEQTKLTLPPQPAELTIRLFELSSLRGIVQGPDGRPVAKADVTYRVLGGALDFNTFGNKSTNRRGEFRFGNVPPGEVRLNASAPGFAAAPDKVLQVGREQDLRDLVLVLGRGVRIEGQVVHADGRPAVDANVSWRNTERKTGEDIAVGAEGRFLAEGVPAGPLVLTARIPFRAVDGGSNGTTETTAERVLADGDVWSMTLREERPRLQVAEVRVRDNGVAWAGVRVSLEQRGEGVGWNVRGETDETGLVRLEVPGPGEYEVTLGRGDDRVQGICTLDAGARLDLDLSTGGVRGRIVVPEGSTPMFVQVLLEPDEEASGPFRLTPRTLNVDDDGGFQAERVLAGRYRIRGRGPTLDRELLVSPAEAVRITRGTEAGPLELTLSEKGEMSELGELFGGRRRR